MPKIKMLPKVYRDQLPRTMVRALDELRVHEERIIERLGDERVAQLFAENPAEALKQMGVPVDPLLARGLQEATRRGLPHRFSSYVLPNGQTVTPSVRIRFMKGAD